MNFIGFNFAFFIKNPILIQKDNYKTDNRQLSYKIYAFYRHFNI